ncbi:hypothetical protein [Rhodopila sp.]|uniref:hypothetical protein n=1 Tax=Rhodopila sp. TaxID=2480087 RepID=UPI003D1419D8
MATSPNNTIIMTPNTILTDANGNQWFINTAGQVVVNGVVDPTTGQVQTLAYENGRVWQMNTSDLWWSKALPSDAWGPTYGTAASPLVGVASPNDDVYPGVGASVTDADDNRWTITAGGQVAVNGVADPTTGRVDELAYYNGLVWQKNADNHWYSKSSAASGWVAWQGAAAPVPIPFVSANDTWIRPGTAGSGSGGGLTDANGNYWTLGAPGGRGEQVIVDGAVDPTTANVVEMALVSGVIWQENSAGLWYSKTAPSGAWSAGTTLNPFNGSGRVPSSLTWVGGGNNLASNAADWSPGFAPEPGDVLSIGSGTIDVAGNALAGDTLTIVSVAGSQPAVSTVINTSGAATLNLAVANTPPYAFAETLRINVAAGSTLTLNANVGSEATTISGGTVNFVGANSFVGKTVLADNLVGSGSIAIPSGNHLLGSVEVNGSVGSGLSFIMQSESAASDLTIDQPNRFAGLIQLGPAPVALGHVLFAGIQASSAELLGGVLQMFNGSTLVDSARFNNPGGLAVQLHQVAAGVVLTAGSFNDTGNAGTVIPLKA